ncbi:hypothetical protein QBC46DRAFT_421551 [Diplogelasinospora grovesii]|uniref:Uncharacterized protein n=1 Tax=Diplogelasinospora grovesii TaxID=303347 RepID=A0AAN6NCG2_9PEZI|nr:hypothetical protein QBC46DRAFT_421551 [Diplogelasinospora grovesii]
MTCNKNSGASGNSGLTAESRPLCILGLASQIPITPPLQYLSTSSLKALGFDTFRSNLPFLAHLTAVDAGSVDRWAMFTITALLPSYPHGENYLDREAKTAQVITNYGYTWQPNQQDGTHEIATLCRPLPYQLLTPNIYHIGSWRRQSDISFMMPADIDLVPHDAS